MENKIKVITEDITKLKTDAIVNAANTGLLGGGGVDGAIHRAAGHELFEECKKLNGCHTGESKITKAYKLPCKYVIHTVGPVWNKGNKNEENLLANCYKNSLNIAKKYNITTIAFPNISTGIYHFPKKLAAKIAINQVKNFLQNNNNFKEIIFVCFDKENFDIYTELLNQN
jgi:O-acetyl-ADP-ribose deacetylase (regulator of RNase III)